MNPPQVYTCSQSWIPLPPPSHTIPLGHPSAPAPSILYPASNLDWRFVSYLILYMFQCHSPKSSSPPSPTESKRLFYTSVFLLLSCIQGYHYHLSKFHIYALVYCTGVFLSGLLHSVLSFVLPQSEIPHELSASSHFPLLSIPVINLVFLGVLILWAFHINIYIICSYF